MKVERAPRTGLYVEARNSLEIVDALEKLY